MPTAQTGSVTAMPGQDSVAHSQPVRQNIAVSLGQIQNQQVDPAHLVPPSQQLITPPNDLSGGIKTEADLEEIINAEKGRPRTDPSRNFLKVLFGRLTKKHPNSLIKPKEG